MGNLRYNTVDQETAIWSEGWEDLVEWVKSGGEGDARLDSEASTGH